MTTLGLPNFRIYHRAAPSDDAPDSVKRAYTLGMFVIHEFFMRGGVALSTADRAFAIFEAYRRRANISEDEFIDEVKVFVDDIETIRDGWGELVADGKALKRLAAFEKRMHEKYPQPIATVTEEA
jgi:hypothetical protein